MLAVLLTCLFDTLAGPYSAGNFDADNGYDAPIPGWVGPHGMGLARWDVGGTVYNPDNYVNPRFAGWATHVVSYVPAAGVWPEFQVSSRALGPATGDAFDIVSLGDLTQSQLEQGLAPGSITLGFELEITDGPGADFAVFENALFSSYDPFGYAFGELAYVEVGTHTDTFARFPPVYLCADGGFSTNNGRDFAAFDPTEVYNLAGKHINNSGACWGTPFDLHDLTNHARVLDGSVDLERIRYVRLIDIPGNGTFFDAQNPSNAILDAWVTEQSGGFDLEAVGVIHFNTDCEIASPVQPGRIPVSWLAVSNRMYQVQRSDAGSSLQWRNLGTPVRGDNTVHSLIDTGQQAQARMYRIMQYEE
jgi:hypothetical protein